MTAAQATRADDAGASAQQPWLSIMLPVYNVAPYLEECLLSILSQADEGVEILLCDDCSTDDSMDVARKVADEHPGRITIMQNPQNLGLSGTRNAMKDRASGRYFWFVDSDDYLLPGAISALKTWIDREAPDVLSFKYRRGHMRKKAFRGPSNTVVHTPAKILAGIYRSRKMYSWAKVSHRKLWEGGLEFPVGKLFEDQYNTPLLALAAQTLVHIDKSLLVYRKRPGSILAQAVREKEQFAEKAHRDMAHAADRVREEMARTPDAETPESRFAMSHFLAREFAKTCERIERAGSEGCGGKDPRELAREFRAIMDGNSPIPFEEMLRLYRRPRHAYSYTQLRKALRFTA
ncbi:glycosyltransferase family 2 protein [Paraurantiacibacter namhicola]|uniref:Putative glycosyltransferase EpsJ n=1 Tax=Paraurantiacibacter namhicola TaxID=645517 RepID=A0A1C7D9L6_9SPHN|nr:glycosyltransferase family 2 protein [Paraurantiacibacter namhicola]ANU08125.1 putative glycosyltransferase EpsJ [Paraurantiacibacter namhicola]